MRKIALFLLPFVIFVSLLVYFLNTKEPYRIAFVAGLSGKYSSLGNQERDGFLLAAEEINAKGGIRGRKIACEIFDDKQESTVIKEIFSDIGKRGYKIVVGPATSSMAKEIIDMIGTMKNITVISPTVSSPFFSDKDDNFIKFGISENSNAIGDMAKHIEKRGIKKVLVVYDGSNTIYSKEWKESFEKLFEGKGEVFGLEIYPDKNYIKDIKNKLDETDFEGVILCVNSIVAAKSAQAIKLKNREIPLYASGWAYSRDLIELGGSAVEGLMIVSSYSSKSNDERFVKFKNAFAQRFGKNPDAFSLRAYDTLNHIATALEEDADENNLKNSMIKIGRFKGVQKDVEINRFGDVINHQDMILTIKDGVFEKIEP